MSNTNVVCSVARCPWCDAESAIVEKREGRATHLNRGCHHAIRTYEDGSTFTTHRTPMIRFSQPNRSENIDVIATPPPREAHIYEGTVIERIAAILTEVQKDQGQRGPPGVGGGSIPIMAGLDSLQDYIEELTDERHDLEFSQDWEKTLTVWLEGVKNDA